MPGWGEGEAEAPDPVRPQASPPMTRKLSNAGSHTSTEESCHMRPLLTPLKDRTSRDRTASKSSPEGSVEGGCPPSFPDHRHMIVACRVRPAFPGEPRCVSVGDDERTVAWFSRPAVGKSANFTFDYVAGEYTSQEEVFNKVGRPVTDACIEGFNATIFCYGQTGSGKTFTTFGPPPLLEHSSPQQLERTTGHRPLSSGLERFVGRGAPDSGAGSRPTMTDSPQKSDPRRHTFGGGAGDNALGVLRGVREELAHGDGLGEGGGLPRISNQRGLVPRVLEYMFASIRGKETRECTPGGLEMDVEELFSCRCSFYEIYKEQVYDLAAGEGFKKAGNPLVVREDKTKGVFIEGLMEEEVKSAEEAADVLCRGQASRYMFGTSMNSESSRTHAVFTLAVSGVERKESVIGRTRSRDPSRLFFPLRKWNCFEQVVKSMESIMKDHNLPEDVCVATQMHATEKI